MSRIRMYVYIHNESDATLMRTATELTVGDWTPDWFPPEVIMPGETKAFQGEGELAAGLPWTGTEGNVRYQLQSPDSGGEVYIHWNSPLIESQYENTFHIWGPEHWEITHWGGQGHEGELHIRIRRSVVRRVPNFNPRGRGFAFRNSWNSDLPVITVGYLLNRLFDSLSDVHSALGIAKVDDNWLPITHADAGMCGGMVYAVMDYFTRHMLPPPDLTSPTSQEDILFQYIRDRLWDSFDVAGEGHRFLSYSSPSYPNGDEGFVQGIGLMKGRSWITYREAWPEIQRDIDAGRLSPMGLIQTDELKIGDNHQVLAYGYYKSGQKVTLYIYDPNKGQNEVTFDFDITATDGEVDVVRKVNGVPAADKRIFCFFRINNYTSNNPPGGRRIISLRQALLASTSQPYSASISTRYAIPDSGNAISVLNWMHSL